MGGYVSIDDEVVEYAMTTNMTFLQLPVTESMKKANI
jgi:hypothetical protein